MLVRAPHLRPSRTANGFLSGRPGRAIFDPVQYSERVNDRFAEATESSRETGIELVAGRSIMAVENLIHHGDHSFRLLVLAQWAKG